MKSSQRDYALDFLKIVATAGIVFHHYQFGTSTKFATGINFYGGRFYFGNLVELFFLLSGYFIVGYGEKIRNGLSFKEFYVRRMVRLLPLVAVSGAAAEILSGMYLTVYNSPYLERFTPSIWAFVTDCLGIRKGWVFSPESANYPNWYVSVLLLCYLMFFLANYLSKRCKIPVFYFYVGMVLLGCGIACYEPKLPLFN